MLVFAAALLALPVPRQPGGKVANSMKRWNAVAVVVLLLAMPVPAPAGWRADCRAAARACRKSHGATATTTTTTIPGVACGSPNCHGHCIMVNGQLYVSIVDALSGNCSLPMPPDCSL